METPTTRTDRLAQARAEAERRWPRKQSPGDPYPADRYRRMTMDRRIGFELGVVWADANPAPHTITPEELGAAYAALMQEDGHPVRRFENALRTLGIRVEGDDDEAH